MQTKLSAKLFSVILNGEKQAQRFGRELVSSADLCYNETNEKPRPLGEVAAKPTQGDKMESTSLKKHRIEYLICTLSVVVTGFIIYGFIGSIEPLINESKLQSFLLCGCLGGFGFSSIVSTIILSVGFFKKRGLTFKIVASVLWPITFAACVYVGIVTYIPYQIFNIVKLISMTKEERKTKSSEIINEDQ